MAPSSSSSGSIIIHQGILSKIVKNIFPDQGIYKKKYKKIKKIKF